MVVSTVQEKRSGKEAQGPTGGGWGKGYYFNGVIWEEFTKKVTKQEQQERAAWIHKGREDLRREGRARAKTLRGVSCCSSCWRSTVGAGVGGTMWRNMKRDHRDQREPCSSCSHTGLFLLERWKPLKDSKKTRSGNNSVVCKASPGAPDSGQGREFGSVYVDGFFLVTVRNWQVWGVIHQKIRPGATCLSQVMMHYRSLVPAMKPKARAQRCCLCFPSCEKN